MNKLKMAACGIDCAECGSYKVTAEHDIKAAEELVEWYKNMGWIGENEGAEAVMKKNPLCKGCWNTTDDCFFRCGRSGECNLRTCCIERKINHCGECIIFPCEVYKKFAEGHENHKKAMEHLLSIRKVCEEISKREKIRFGKYDWYILDYKDGKTLVITEKVIEKRAYHNNEDEITWENSDIRKYLNGEFYNSFSETERERIIEAINENNDNPWDGTSGGNSTTDRIFLLSIDEAVKYFGDSGKLQTKQFGPKGEAWWFNDQYDTQRSAKFGSKNAWWWLRSPGYIGSRAAYISIGGTVHIHGECAGSKGKGGGIRPALWLRD